MISDMDVICQRIERLERENRNLKRIGFTTVLFVFCVALMGLARQSHPVVEAQKIVVLDSQGRPRITLGTPSSSGAGFGLQTDDPAIWMSDENGTDRLILTTDGIRLSDERGRPRLLENPAALPSRR
jgi:hypothetical protein